MIVIDILYPRGWCGPALARGAAASIFPGFNGTATFPAGCVIQDAVAIVKTAFSGPGGTLTMGLGGGESTNSLDPGLDASQFPFMYMSTMGNMLTTVDPKGNLEASLAESWDSSPDAITWTFKIRKGVEFHNGATMTVDDVVKTLQSIGRRSAL